MKQAKDIMTTNPACCMPENSVEEAAQMMVEHDCGEIPVVESKDNPKPVGVITDRDITCRVVAAGKNPRQARVRAKCKQHESSAINDASKDAITMQSRERG